VVTGVPTKNYKLPIEWIQKNTTVVNVASFKNVDEDELLKIPGVVYVSMVGKVTVAMLERNLMRLYEQFHSPRHPLDADNNNVKALQEQSSWSLRLQAYSAAVLTLILAMQLVKN
jgi:methylenetetrahydrofolate dehydrogenase (NAD+)